VNKRTSKRHGVASKPKKGWTGRARGTNRNNSNTHTLTHLLRFFNSMLLSGRNRHTTLMLFRVDMMHQAHTHRHTKTTTHTTRPAMARPSRPSVTSETGVLPTAI